VCSALADNMITGMCGSHGVLTSLPSRSVRHRSKPLMSAAAQHLERLGPAGGGQHGVVVRSQVLGQERSALATRLILLTQAVVVAAHAVDWRAGVVSVWSRR
jgi:hypothetical protein